MLPAHVPACSPQRHRPAVPASFPSPVAAISNMGQRAITAVVCRRQAPSGLVGHLVLITLIRRRRRIAAPTQLSLDALTARSACCQRAAWNYGK